MNNKDLALIVKQVKLNKEVHFEKLYEATWETVYFLSLNMMGNEYDAEDVTQEIFIKIYNKIDQLKVTEAFNRWMNTLVMNTCKTALSKRNTSQIYNSKEENIDDVAVESNIDFLPADLVNSKETRAIVDTIIQELPEKQKQAILLHYYQEFSVSQISEILECTTAIVNSRLHYAKVTLRSKAECFQKDHGIKLYDVSAIPVLSIILKTYANEVCNDTTRVSIWNEVSTKLSIGASIPVVSQVKKLFSKAKNKPLSGIASTSSSFVSNALIVLGSITMIVSTGYVINDYVNNKPVLSDSLNVNKTSKVDKNNNKESSKKDIDKINEFSKDAIPDVEGETTTISDTIIESEAQVSNEVPIVTTPEVVVQGTKISTISTTSSEMNLPAGSIITNGVGDRIFMASDGTLETDGSITTAGNIATVPFALVNQIQLDSLGNRLLPTGTILNNLDGTTSTYSGNIQVDKQNNSIKKLPFEVDVASGDLNIELIDDKLVITGSDVEIIIEKDTVIDIINTSSEDRTIIVDGCDVAFGKTEATIKVINDGRAIRQTITTTSTIKNFIPGTISTTTKRNKLKGSRSLLEPVKKEVTDRLNLDTNPLAKTNGAKETMLNMMIIINLIILVIIILLFVYKHKEKEKMKLKNILKTTAITFLAIFVASNGMMNNLLAEEEQEPTVGIGETTKIEPVTPEQEVEIITYEEDKVATATPVATASASLGISKLNEVVVTEEVVGVETLEEGVTILSDAFPDVNFRTYVAETVLGKTYVDATDSETTLTADDITKITVNTTGVNVASKGIVSMEGIQHFINLKVLKCGNNQIENINVTNLLKLTDLQCQNNKISILDVASLVNLITLRCDQNKISILNISKLELIKILYCQNNLLEELDISKLKNLTTIYCQSNKLSALDVSNLSDLSLLYCGKNLIKELDISKLYNLEKLNCEYNQISILDVSLLSKLTYLACPYNNISILDVSKLENLTTIYCNNNKIVVLDLSNINDLLVLSCYNNNISVLDLSNFNNLYHLSVHTNPIDDLVINESCIGNMRVLEYRNTNIKNMNLSGFYSLIVLSVTKSSNSDLSNLTSLYISGSRPIYDQSNIRLTGEIGTFSWNNEKEYYLIEANKNAKYGFTVPYSESPTGNTFTPTDKYIFLNEGGLVDQEGNLIIGATLDNIEDDGTIKIFAGSSMATPEGTITFDGDATLKDGVITTASNFIIDKNTISTNPTTGSVSAVIGGNKTTVEVGSGVTTINSIGSVMNLPAGSEVTNNAGDKTFLNEAGTVDSLGVVNSDGITVTVPADKVVDITIDEDGLIIIPKGSTIKDEDGITIVYPGGIVIDETNHTVTELPLDFDLSAGPITITVNGDGQNVVNQNGVDTILDKDVVINILNTEDTDNKVVVEGSEITIENIDGDLEAVNGSNVHVTGDVTGNVIIDDTSTVTVDGTIGGSVTNNGGNFNGNGNVTGDVTTNNGGTSIIVGNVDGDVITDGTDSNTTVTGNVDGSLESTTGGDIHVTGDVAGNVTVDTDSSATVDGNIGGNVNNNGGTTDVTGIITGDVNTNTGGSTNVEGTVEGNVITDGTGSITTITGDVNGNVDSTNGGETIVTGNVGGNTNTDGTDSTTNIGGNVDGTVTDSNGGETTVGGNAIYALQTADAYALLEKVNAVDATKYTKASITKLNETKAEVMNILEPATLSRAIVAHPSQASLDTAVANLQAAYDGLVLINVVVNPTKPVVSTGLELPLMSIIALSFGVSAIILRRKYIK